MVQAIHRLISEPDPKSAPRLPATARSTGFSYPNAANPYPNAIAPPGSAMPKRSTLRLTIRSITALPAPAGMPSTGPRSGRDSASASSATAARSMSCSPGDQPARSASPSDPSTGSRSTVGGTRPPGSSTASSAASTRSRLNPSRTPPSSTSRHAACAPMSRSSASRRPRRYPGTPSTSTSCRRSETCS